MLRIERCFTSANSANQYANFLLMQKDYKPERWIVRIYKRPNGKGYSYYFLDTEFNPFKR